MTKRPELPPLRQFDFFSRNLILNHKLAPLIEDKTIHRLENDHEVITARSIDSHGKDTTIPVVRFRVLFGFRDYADFIVTDDYQVCRYRKHGPRKEFIIPAWDGDELAKFVRRVVKKMEAAA